MPDFRNARTQVNSAVHVHINNTNEHIIHEELNFKGKLVISMDLSLITKDLQIKIQEKTDGSNYRIKSFNVFDQARFDVSSVVDNGGEAQFNTVGSNGIAVGDIIINRDFTDPNYNGTFTVTEVTATSYTIDAITFAADDTTGYVVQDETSNEFPFGNQVVVSDTEGSGNDLKLTFQSPVAEGVDRNIPLTLRVTIPQ